MSDARTVVVTGGTGALGTGVVDVLLEAGFAPVVTWVVERERDAAAAAVRLQGAPGAAGRDGPRRHEGVRRAAR